MKYAYGSGNLTFPRGSVGTIIKAWINEHHRIFPIPVVVRIQKSKAHILVESDGRLLGIRHQESTANVGSNIQDDDGQ